MPMNTLKQARISLHNKRQREALVELLSSLGPSRTTVALEETNLQGGDALAVVSNHGTSVVTVNGEVHKIGHGA